MEGIKFINLLIIFTFFSCSRNKNLNDEVYYERFDSKMKIVGYSLRQYNYINDTVRICYFEYSENGFKKLRTCDYYLNKKDTIYTL